MPNQRASITAILGPTNTGKTHLAVERMCAHSSGMIGFPLRLLAREIYDRIVKIKGVGQVALITGEERIEPINARYYCCTVESMLMERDFAFIAVDEVQLGIDPERGHIFTDRLLNARGREETMLLGSESLRSVIRKLLPDAEIITRPRFSTLSYGGTKKLSRLPKRSAIVAFSVEQVYVVAELLRRLRGGAAVVMGALSPRTRNAQVAMFQSGDVDYLVATDAIGMGLNLDVTHVAFAGLAKFDGSRRRRLSIAEMAQIAGRAGRHQQDGTFGTLSGESSDFTSEEIMAIENHSFPRLDWLYWRESRPRTDSIANLIADLESRPDHAALRAAPPAVDLDVLKRLSENADTVKLATNPQKVARLWETASLPDFRQMGAEFHARFVASLWQHLGQGDGFLPYVYVASELARLDNIQGDVATLSARIAAVRTWTYIAYRKDWLADPAAMALRAMAVEEKLSDALHDALRQRFVDKRTVMLLRKGSGDIGLLPVAVDADNIVSVDGEEIGSLDGFTFRVDPAAKAGDRKLLLAAAERHLAALLKQKARDVFMAEDSEFSLGVDSERRPALIWNGSVLGLLGKGRSLMQPVFRPAKAVSGLEGDALRLITERAEIWITGQIEKHLGGVAGLDLLGQDANTDGNVRALAVQLAESGGIAGRVYLADALAALPKESRGAARKSGIVFGALDVFHHAALKPAAVRWRIALFAARDDKPVADLPPESAVHLKEWNFASIADCRNAGYRRIADEYLRIDLAERVIKKAHEARGQALLFGMDMAFATSLGVSEVGLAALMRDAGFRKGDAPIADAVIKGPTDEPLATQAIEPTIEPILTYWRWVGIRKPKPLEQRHAKRPEKRASQNDRKTAKPERVSKPAPPASPPSSLALQLAALQNLNTTKSG
jgi:ATP-dependent RNA helicase SUPV3L1/SUV3